MSSQESSNEPEVLMRGQRIFNFVSLFAFSFAFIEMWEGMVINLYWSLSNGGAPECVWGFIVALPGALAQCASLAEMVSLTVSWMASRCSSSSGIDPANRW